MDRASKSLSTPLLCFLAPLLALVLMFCADVLQVDCCSMFLWDEQRQRLAMVASKGYLPSFHHYVYHYESQAGICHGAEPSTLTPKR